MGNEIENSTVAAKRREEALNRSAPPLSSNPINIEANAAEVKSNYPKKLSAALEILRCLSIRRGNYAPPLYRFLWGAGWYLRPPHFGGFISNFLITGGFFGFVWFAILLMAIPFIKHSAVEVFIVAVKAGGMFGCAMGIYYMVSQRIHKLPKWKELDG